MWHLKSIQATNLCSFLDLRYSPKRGAATLIFGNNLDSDSQNSNGSGKSALIEAIAIGLTGDPLRKVNVDEIINDTKEEATITIELSNDSLCEDMAVTRRLSRSQPQQIQITKKGYQSDTAEEISQASVSDYNKYILDQIGLSKEDIFSNFILTARKYKSFLASSDKEKKELINRFSNGVIVDKSIEELRLDIAPIEENLQEAEKEVAMCTGRVEALGTEIEKAVKEAEDRKLANVSRIKDWENLISQKRADIREANNQIDQIDESLDSLDKLDGELQNLEGSDKDVSSLFDIVSGLFKDNGLAFTTDYANTVDSLNAQLGNATIKAKEASKKSEELQSALSKQEADYKEACHELAERSEQNKSNLSECSVHLEKLAKEIRRIQNKAVSLDNDERDKKREAATLTNQLAGVIQCPKCKHEFTLSADIDIDVARKNLKAVESEISKIEEALAKNSKEYDKTVLDGKNQREIETALNNESREIKQELDEAEQELKSVRRAVEQQSEEVERVSSQLSLAQDKLSNVRKNMFDEAFEILDGAYKHRENKIKSLQEEINTMNGSISSYENAIKSAKQASEEDILVSLNKSLEDYKEALKTAVNNKEKIEGEANQLKIQEAHFTEFKTYLANTKINAISQITNEFLETIGSDIRVALSGYTILKSGKVRDKISVSLLRDGLNCGSFEKFSAGERVRVELASILSMNKLTNLNCEEGKGLDLLIADEVLDSADEQGLASVFKALNKTQITSLVVSHGLVNESYPNKITVTKSNGVSSIYETATSNN